MPGIEVSEQLYSQLQPTDGAENIEEELWRLVYESRRGIE